MYQLSVKFQILKEIEAVKDNALSQDNLKNYFRIFQNNSIHIRNRMLSALEINNRVNFEQFVKLAAYIEFKAVPTKEQAAFWQSVIDPSKSGFISKEEF